VYEVALTVAACLRAGTRVDVAWAVAADDAFGAWDRGEALAITPGGGRVGGVLSGALNDQLVDLVARVDGGRLVDVEAADWEAQLHDLPRGGKARCLLMPAADLPGDLWELLRRREPVCLVTTLNGDMVDDVALYDRESVPESIAALFNRGTSVSTVDGSTVTTVLWPVPTLVIAGGGPIVDPLAAIAEAVGWRPQVVRQPSAATGLIAGLAQLDSVVVLGHDDDLTGPALAAALDSPAGYIGSVGSRAMQQSRADWLAYRGITDLDRIHGPAGLDIGAGSPAEIAVSIIAEAISVRS
jgi:xanthine dehydrogenase accessory factor